MLKLRYRIRYYHRQNYKITMKNKGINLTSILVCLFLASCGSTEPRPYDAEHCSGLLAEAEELKGKPQRRAAVMQRYNADCTGS